MQRHQCVNCQDNKLKLPNRYYPHDRHREEVGGAVRDVDMVDSPAYACTEQHVYDHPQVRPNTATAVNSYKNIAVMSDSSH